jgi:hypothetical protein
MLQRLNVLVSILFLFAIGAAAQTVTTSTSASAVGAQDNRAAISATAPEARLNEPAELFMSHLQSHGLLDHAFMKVTASLAPHDAPTALVGCQPTCEPGLVCCLCLSATCETRAQCNLDCQK